MSDEHDHSHPHNGEQDLLVRPRRVTAPVAPEPLPPEDAGSQALAEALKSSFAIVKWLMVLLFVVFLCSGFFKVEPGKKAVILRFGKPQQKSNAELLGPGLHWAFPAPIDEVRKIPYAQFQSVRSSVGWYNTTPEKEASGQEDLAGISLNPAVDGYAITGDQNIIHCRADLTYRIEDPIRYVFEFSDASNAVQNAVDNAILYAAARFKVDDALTRDITRFQDTVRQRVTELVQQENLGIAIEQCQVRSIPPRYLKPAFDGVLTALSARETMHNEALKDESKILNEAASQAAQRTNSAEAESVRLVESVKAEAKRFQELLPRYKANPTLFANVLLNETISRTMTNVQDKIFLPERADGKTRELRLQLSREPLKPPPNQQP